VAFNVVTQGDHLDTNPWTGTVGATIDQPVFGGRDGYFRIDGIFQSEGLINPVTDPQNGGYDPAALPAPSTFQLNMRGGVRWDRYDISLFINNVTNTHPELTRYSEVIGNPVHRDFTFRPLTVGLTAAYRY
jgi:outer membrane receptor protein involved in Fe transport